MSSSKPQLNLPPSTQSGFTIIECLLAIIIVSLLMAAVAPVLALSVATRVQSRRVELATAAAKSYIDGLRSGAILPPPIGTTAPPTGTTALANAVVPSTSSLDCKTNRDYCTTPTNLYCINFDGFGCTDNSPKNILRAMIIQPIAYNPNQTTPATASQGYQLGIRVYRADAFNGTNELKAGKDQKKDQPRVVAASFTGGLGDKQAPLVEMTTEIVTDLKKNPTGSPTKFIDLCKRVYLTKNTGATADEATTKCS